MLVEVEATILKLRTCVYPILASNLSSSSSIVAIRAGESCLSSRDTSGELIEEGTFSSVDAMISTSIGFKYAICTGILKNGEFATLRNLWGMDADMNDLPAQHCPSPFTLVCSGLTLPRPQNHVHRGVPPD